MAARQGEGDGHGKARRGGSGQGDVSCIGAERAQRQAVRARTRRGQGCGASGVENVAGVRARQGKEAVTVRWGEGARRR